MWALTFLIPFFITFATCASSSDSVWRFNRCPAQCDCVLMRNPQLNSTLRTVDCAHRQMVSMPDSESIPADTQVLLLNNNRLQQLCGATRLWLPDLLVLDGSHNELSTMPSEDRPDMFEGVYNVRHLSLSHNHLTALQDNSFLGLFNLELLDVSHNALHSLAPNTFRGMLKLETLHLHHNQLTHVHNELWTHIDSLYALDLSYNRLTLLQMDAVRPLRRLVSLNLAHNRLSDVHEHVFSDSPLKSLDLSNNQLPAVPQKALIPLRPTLQALTFDSNPIDRLNTDDIADFARLSSVSVCESPNLQMVDLGALKRLPALLIVRLHDNPQLGWLDGRGLVDTPQLTHLYLHNNRLSTLHQDTVLSAPALEQITIYGNPLYCDCNLRWLMLTTTSHHNNINFMELDRVQCHGPFEHSLKLFHALHLSDLPQQCAPRLIPLFPSNTPLQQGQSTVLPCRAVGQPAPRLRWLAPHMVDIQSSAYHPRRYVSAQSLVLRHVTSADEGCYSCVAESPLGTDVLTTQVQVHTVKVQLRAVRMDSDSITVQWFGEDRHNHPYKLTYTNMDQALKHTIMAATLTPVMSAYTIHNLLPDCTYKVCMSLHSDQQLLAPVHCVQTQTAPAPTSFWKLLEQHENLLGMLCLSLMIISVLLLIVILRHTHRTHGTYQCLPDLKHHDKKQLHFVTIPHRTAKQNIYSALHTLNSDCNV